MSCGSPCVTLLRRIILLPFGWWARTLRVRRSDESHALRDYLKQTRNSRYSTRRHPMWRIEHFWTVHVHTTVARDSLLFRGAQRIDKQESEGAFVLLHEERRNPYGQVCRQKSKRRQRNLSDWFQGHRWNKSGRTIWERYSFHPFFSAWPCLLFLGGAKKSLHKPTSIIDYNRSMAGVDLSDSTLHHAYIDRKSYRWFVKLGFHFLSRLLFNSFVMYREHVNKTRFSSFLSTYAKSSWAMENPFFQFRSGYNGVNRRLSKASEWGNAASETNEITTGLNESSETNENAAFLK